MIMFTGRNYLEMNTCSTLFFMKLAVEVPKTLNNSEEEESGQILSRLSVAERMFVMLYFHHGLSIFKCRRCLGVVYRR